MTTVPTLLSPVQIGDLNLKNRVAMAPLTRGRADASGIPQIELMTEYYTARAELGLIISEAVPVSKQGYGWANVPGIWSQEQVDAFRPIVESVHNAGGVIFAQLWHCGRAAHSDFFGIQPVSPSELQNEGETHIKDGTKVPFEVPRQLSADELPGIVEDFRVAAKNAKEAGFDGIELHGANGYLLDSFTQSKVNNRTDDYGGSIENRIRFPIEVLEAVLKEFPSNRVGYRISPNGVYNTTGSTDFRETFLKLSEKLSTYNLAYLHVVDGLAFGYHELGEPLTLSEIRAVFSGPIIGNCGYTKEDAEKAIVDGNADMISFGRPSLANPDLIRRFREDLPLNDSDFTTWFTNDAVGYTDYPYYEDKQ